MASITINDLRHAIRHLHLAGQAVCVHSSLRSFGHMEDGARAVVQAFLEEGCTFLVPTFIDIFELRSQPGLRPARNGWQYETEWDWQETPGQRLVYRPEGNEIAPEMGQIPAAVLRIKERVRGNHPLCSFSAVGPLAEKLISGQRPLDVFAPLEELAQADGQIILMGVGLNRLTLLHLAEKLAGRNLFRRWANGNDGRPMMVECGGCSGGFEKLRPSLAGILREHSVGGSRWIILPARETLHLATEVIRTDPMITHCGRAECERCRDSVLGGPILEARM